MNKRDENMQSNLIKSTVILTHQLEQIHWKLNYMKETYNENINERQTAEIMNKIESVLAESEYLWDNRYEDNEGR